MKEKDDQYYEKVALKHRIQKGRLHRVMKKAQSKLLCTTKFLN